jgi:UDP-glucose 4-epimerase
MMIILVSGGLGFVGINIVQYLAQLSYVEKVVAADILEPDPVAQSFLQQITPKLVFRKMDVADLVSYRSLVEEFGVTSLIHAAAITPDLDYERAHAARVVEVNLSGALNAMAIGYQSPSIKRVLLCSSSGIYGSPRRKVPLQAEKGPLDLDNLYAITKYSAELIAGRYTRLCGKTFCAVRLGSVYGPMERPTGSRQNMSHIQRLRSALLAGRKVRLAGADISRDWVYALDVAEAVRALLCAPVLTHTVYNVGLGEAFSFRQVVEAFVPYGLRVEWVDEPDQADIFMRQESERAALDIRRLKKDAGFIPCFGISAGVSDYMQKSMY